jgi:hypothetical protein
VFFANARNTIEEAIKDFHHEEEVVLANTKDMWDKILESENDDVCVEIPNFI